MNLKTNDYYLRNDGLLFYIYDIDDVGGVAVFLVILPDNDGCYFLGETSFMFISNQYIYTEVSKSYGRQLEKLLSL
jgi:hypothetical protein